MSSPRQGPRGFVGVWPRAGVAVAVVAFGMAAGVGLASVTLRDEPESSAEPEAPSAQAAGCDGAGEVLDIVAEEAVVEIVQELADSYTADLLASGRPCLPIEVRPVVGSAVVGRLTNGWRSDTHGPRPDAWIPQSTVWLELLRSQLDDPSILPEDPTVLARSPVVMALPRPMAERLGWPDERLRWQDFYELADDDAGWGKVGRPAWGPFRLDLTDPRYTTTGLQALLAFDAAVGSTETLESGTPLSLFSVQRVAAHIDASSEETLERYASADAPLRSLSAAPLEERAVWRFNEATGTAPGGSASPTAAASDGPADRPELVAMYPTGGADIAMEADYPYVMLDASWVSSGVMQLADEFGDYLRSDTAAPMFADAGFRTPENQPGEVLRGADGMRALDQVAQSPPGDLPDVARVRELRRSWVTLPRVSRTLMLVDVSGSMVVAVPDGSRTRLEATIDAARKSLEVIPNGGDVGLWEFSTDLPGGRHGGDYRELVPLGPLNEVVDGESRKRRISAALDTLGPQNDTALNDTVVAAYREMRSGYEPGSQHTIVLLTDGRNDDADSISHEAMLRRLRRLHQPGQPIDVVSIAFGEEPDLDMLAEISDTVGGRVIASPKQRNLDRVFIEALRR